MFLLQQSGSWLMMLQTRPNLDLFCCLRTVIWHLWHVCGLQTERRILANIFLGWGRHSPRETRLTRRRSTIFKFILWIYRFVFEWFERVAAFIPSLRSTLIPVYGKLVRISGETSSDRPFSWVDMTLPKWFTKWTILRRFFKSSRLHWCPPFIFGIAK